MNRGAAWVSLAALLLAGCAQDEPPEVPGPPAAEADPLPPSYGPAVCDNILLFQLVDYGETDPYLPPGFHPRDPQAFLNSPAAFGSAGVLFMGLDCESAEDGPFAAAFLGIFVEAPKVEGVVEAPINFYELRRYGPGPEFGGALEATGWPKSTANVTFHAVAKELAENDLRMVVTDAEGEVAMLEGTLAVPTGPIGGNVTRFWVQGPNGLAYVEYRAPLAATVGSGICEARAGTPLAAFIERTPIGGHSCLPGLGGDPVFAVLNGLQLNATLHDLRGLRTG